VSGLLPRLCAEQKKEPKSIDNNLKLSIMPISRCFCPCIDSFSTIF
jgi:hypothetical protein